MIKSLSNNSINNIIDKLCKDSQIKKNFNLYSKIHTILVFFSIYLSIKCNKGFNLISFISAIFCPHIYIIYILAIHGSNFCIN